MTDRPAAPILSRPFILADVSPEGTHVRITATPEECAAFARDLDIPGVARIAAELLIKPWGRSGFRVTGHVSAAVTQNCVVTLDPVDEAVEEDMDLRFVPAAEAARYEPKRNADGEIELDADAVDAPDVYEGGTLDLGILVEEHLVLGLDPYPRKPGASFDLPSDTPAEAAEPVVASPFAALSRLKKD